MGWLKTAVFNEREEMDAVIAEGLQKSDCKLVARYRDLNNLSERVQEIKPDVAIFALASLDVERVSLIKQLIAGNELPVVIFADEMDPGVIVKIIKSDVGAYIYDGLDPERFPAIVALAVARYTEVRKLRQAVESANTKLEERKAIERAKGLLMTHHKLSEDDAYKALRQLAMNRGQRLVDTAHNTIAMLEMIDKSMRGAAVTQD